MRILVTGGAGFIGSHLVEKLLALGHQAVILDNLATGNQRFIKNIENNKNLTFILGSVLDKDLVDYAMENCDAVFHLAAVLGVKNLVEDPIKVINENIDGTRNILELAFSHKLKVVFASTSEIYGKNNLLPYREDSDRLLGSTSINRWCYATAKALDEHLCFAYAEKGLHVTVVRYFNAYGPRAIASDYGMVIPRFIVAALTNKPLTIYGDGEQTRCFTYVEDIADGTLKCLDNKYNNQAFNIGSDFEITINELALKIKQLTASNSEIIHIPYEKIYGTKYEDTPQRVPDTTRAKQILNFEPAVSLDEGLKRTIEWYKLYKGIS